VVSSPPPEEVAPQPKPGGVPHFVAGISRRVRTLIVAGLLFVVLLVLAMTLPVPYVVLSPGPTCNTLSTCEGQQVITLIGREPRKATGNLNLTTVSYSTQKLTVFDALSAWLQSDEVVVPRSSLFPPGTTTQQVNQQNANDFSQSQDNAVVAAACELGYPKAFGVLDVATKGPSHGKLEPGDVLRTLDGAAVDTYPRLKAVLASKQPGDTVTIVVRRNQTPTVGTDKTVTVTLGQPPKGGKGGSLGITVPPEPECLAPFGVELGLNDQIGGPSAGMMFALGILDLAQQDLTHGKFIAGTGTISPSGTVGPIGGIQLKMIAARNAGATVFLAPAGNCSDVRGAIPDGLRVVKVSTLHGAVRDLQALAKGRPVPGC
jgi:PDZ domain-containing protein